MTRPCIAVIVAAAALVVVPVPVTSQDAPQPRRAGCETPQHRAFDFWVGEWIVELPDGTRSGVNRIELVLSQCALHESWTGEDGNRGHSYSVFDASLEKWHQTWVDAGGNVLKLDGGLEGGSMVMTGLNRTAQGEVRSRVTWTPQPDGRVRQHWEISTDDGGSWSTYYDAYYRRVNRSAP